MNCATKELCARLVLVKKLTSSLLTKVYVLPAPVRVFFNGRHEVCATPLLQYVPDFLNSSCSEEEDTRQRARSEEVTPRAQNASADTFKHASADK